MANNLTSNFSRKLMERFLKGFESSRVLSKSVNTQLYAGKFTDSAGANIDIKRAHDYNAIETATGDISSSTKSDILSGKATATVQNYITVATEWSNLEEATELNQLDEILAPMARRAVTTLELNLGAYMQRNSGLKYGTPGTAIDAWSDVGGAQAFMDSIGVPQDKDWNYVMNPFTQLALADAQNGLSSGKLDLVTTAWQKAQISNRFAGMNVMKSNALKTRTSSDASDRAGTLTATPTSTYVSVKDTMQQTLAVTAFSANAVVKAGDIVQITGRNRLNLDTKEVALDAAGAAILWTATVTADVTLGASGEGNLVVTGPAIIEADGQYNTVDTALTSGDVITILGTASAVYQPALFFHPDAFAIATVKLPKLFSTDTVATTSDGFSLRVSKYSDGDANTQKVRFDLLPAFGTMDPFKAGQGYGV